LFPPPDSTPRFFFSLSGKFLADRVFSFSFSPSFIERAVRRSVFFAPLFSIYSNVPFLFLLFGVETFNPLFYFAGSQRSFWSLGRGSICSYFASKPFSFFIFGYTRAFSVEDSGMGNPSSPPTLCPLYTKKRFVSPPPPFSPSVRRCTRLPYPIEREWQR